PANSVTSIQSPAVPICRVCNDNDFATRRGFVDRSVARPTRYLRKASSGEPVGTGVYRAVGCGKRRRAHHNWCGGRRQTTQLLAEITGRGVATAREDRRKHGVAWRNAVSKRKKSTKILLTENGGQTILP